MHQLCFDYSKLLGRIKENGLTQAALAEKIGMSETTISLKLNNKADFSQREIRKICNTLKIDDANIYDYFFNQKVQKN